MADGDKDEREGLLTTIRARRKWYLGVYSLQMLGWLVFLIVTEIGDVNSVDTVSRRILGAAVTMSVIGQGTLISTVLLIDVVFDGCRYLIGKGAEIMGLLFDNFENKFVVRGRKQGLKQGLAQGEKQTKAQWSEWIADNPEVRELVESGKVRIPPELQVKEAQDDEE